MSGRSLLVLGVAMLLVGGGLASMGLGAHCFTQSDPDVRCGVLLVAVPLAALPLGAGLAVVAAGLAGWLVRAPAEDAEPAGDSPPDPDTEPITQARQP